VSEFITLKKCFSEIEAHHIKNVLDNEGIFNQVVNGTISQVYNFHSPSDGGILIKVHKRDESVARSIIESNPRQDILSENLWDKDVETESNTSKKKRGNAKILYLVLLVLIILAIMAGITSQI
jgi:hypothetical protein